MTYSDYFDIPAGLTYLNTPGNGLLPKRHHQWRTTRERDFFAAEGFLRDQQGAAIEEVKQSIAEVFGARKDSIFCTPNFSFAMQTLLGGLPQHYTFLLLADDYPSLIYPIISRGFTYRQLKIVANMEDAIQHAIEQQQPDVLVLSIVDYITGLKIDLSFLQQLKQRYPDLLIIADGSQYLGTEPIDMENSGIDALACSGYKWLMGGYGNGFIYIKQRLQALIYRRAQGLARPQEAMWSEKSILQTYFEPGHQDTLAQGTLQQSLRFLQDIGLANIQKHIQDVTAYAYQELGRRGLLLPLAEQRSLQSPLINIQLSATHYPTLLEAGIRCFPRGTGIRIGIHLYNTKEDIDTLLAVIDQQILNIKNSEA